ncbi:MAG TPA: gliding motility protein GldC [Ignavibacteriales bacterium]|nr:gliding motility protein GldC [Ignavibacteriales bacterium]
MSKKSEIKLLIHLDDKKMPEKIEWQADDAGFTGMKEAKTMMLSLWDKEDKVTLGIDLWTNDMLIDDMNLHFYQIILKLGDTYRKSTNNPDAAKMFDDFASQFANKIKLFDKK